MKTTAAHAVWGLSDQHVEFAERRKKYCILFMSSLFHEYSNLEYGHIYVIYRVRQAEYVIRILVAVPREYPGHPQMHYLPQAEGVLLHAFNDRG